jgi:hypothetical protein
MNVRLSRLLTTTLVAAVTLLTSGPSWAVYNLLGPSKDEWGLKYEVQVNDAGSGMLTVVFTLADEGRLKPLALIELIALSKETDSQGGHTYDVKAPIVLKPIHDGRRAGQAQMRKEFADRAQIRILSNRVDGQPQHSGWACFEIPINNFLNKAPAAAPLASPPAPKFAK